MSPYFLLPPFLYSASSYVRLKVRRKSRDWMDSSLDLLAVRLADVVFAGPHVMQAAKINRSRVWRARAEVCHVDFVEPNLLAVLQERSVVLHRRGSALFDQYVVPVSNSVVVIQWL